MCNQLLQSVKRQIVEKRHNYQPALHLIKMPKAAIKPEEFRKKVKNSLS